MNRISRINVLTLPYPGKHLITLLLTTKQQLALGRTVANNPTALTAQSPLLCLNLTALTLNKGPFETDNCITCL